VKYDWLYLCNDPAKLRLTLEFLPSLKPYEGLDHLYVGYCSHMDPADRQQELIKTLKWHAPGWLKFGTIDLSEKKGDELPGGLYGYWSTGKTRWSLAMKLLVPFCFEKDSLYDGPFLYTDDDVIVTRDPIALLGVVGWGSKGSFRFPFTKRGIADELFAAFHQYGLSERPYEKYNAHALDAGVFWSGTEFSVSDWRRWLRQFAACDYIKKLTTNNLELRCLDQRFLTMFGIVSGWRQETITNGFAPPRAITPPMLARRPFLHYKTSSKLSKARWMSALETYLIAYGREAHR